MATPTGSKPIASTRRPDQIERLSEMYGGIDKIPAHTCENNTNEHSSPCERCDSVILVEQDALDAARTGLAELPKPKVFAKQAAEAVSVIMGALEGKDVDDACKILEICRKMVDGSDPLAAFEGEGAWNSPDALAFGIFR